MNTYVHEYVEDCDCETCAPRTVKALRARVAELTEQRDNALSEAKESDGVAHAWGVQNKALTARVAELEATLEGIANASPKVFDCPYQDFPHEFLPWARSRARDAIARPTVEVRRG